MDAGTVQNSLLFWCQLTDPIAIAILGRKILAHSARRCARSVFIKHRAPLALASPRQRTMSHRLRKKEHIARLHHGLIDQPHIVLCRTHLSGCWLGCLMTPRHTGKSTIAFVDICQLPRHSNTATENLPILLVIPHRLAKRFAAAVQLMTLCAFARANQQRPVIQAKALAAKLIQTAHHNRMNQQFPKRLAIGFGPAQHARKLAPALFARKRGRTPRQAPIFDRSRSNFIPVVINRIITPLHLIRRQCPPHDQITAQVKKILLLFAHCIKIVAHGETLLLVA